MRETDTRPIESGTRVKWTEEQLLGETTYSGTVVESVTESVGVKPSENPDLDQTKELEKVKIKTDDGEELTTPASTFGQDRSDGITIDRFRPPEMGFRGPSSPTDIGREADGEFARPETDPEITPAPVARNNESGRFGLDPFDISSGTTGVDVDELFGGDQR